MHLIVDKEPFIFADTLAPALLGDQAEEAHGDRGRRGLRGQYGSGPGRLPWKARTALAGGHLTGNGGA